MTGFMLSHLTSEVDTFDDNVASLMQVTLERLRPFDGFCFVVLLVDFYFRVFDGCGCFYNISLCL